MSGNARQHGGRSWRFGSKGERESKVRPLCVRVEDHFDFPARRLCRYFADLEDEYLANRFGRHFRGFHVPLAGRGVLPQDTQECFFYPPEATAEDATFGEMVAFDNLIYIRHSTCEDLVGLVTTYAHEFQHFVQHASKPRLLGINGVLYQNLKRFRPNATEVDIPSEREANIVSKRVAEAIFGPEPVRVFAEEQIRLMERAGEYDQVVRWKFFRDVPSTTSFDLLEATRPLVEQYKTRLDFGIDVNQAEWWSGEWPLREANNAATPE